MAATKPTTPGINRGGIGLGQGIALYVSAILGAGVLVLPGQAASLAGPAAMVAWGFSCLLGVPLALTFAALASAMPDAGGVATYAARAFGPAAGGVAGWWYLVAGSVGQTIVPLTGGYYLAEAFGLGQRAAFPFAGVILAFAVVANLAGVRISGRVQIGLAVAVGVVLLVASVSALPHARIERLTPFAPHGVSGVGQAVVVLFYAFAGWEAVAHLSGEFHDPDRDLRRATAVTIVVVTVLYLGIACAVVSTGTYGSDRVDHVAIGLLLKGPLGISATVGTAAAAVVISLGTTNAFVASVSRLGYALARDGWLPALLGRRNAAQVPVGGILLVGAVGGLGLVASYIAGWGTSQIVFVPATLLVVVYLVGCAAAVRLLSGRAQWVAATAFVLVAATVPFALGHIVVSVVVALLALLIRWLVRAV